MPRRLTLLPLSVLAIAALGLGAFIGPELRPPAKDIAETSTAQAIGGDFQLIAGDGAARSLSSLRGSVVMLFFGYTYCPDNGPGTRHPMKIVRSTLGEDGERVRGLMVSVDPARDTPERLTEYVSYFDPSFIGMTGTREQIDRVVSRYGAAYTLGEADDAGSYTVDHTSLVYLIDGEGAVRHLVTSESSVDQILPLVRELVAEL